MTAAAPPRVVLASLDASTLRAAVEDCRSWRQVLLKLGLRSPHTERVRALCEQWDVAHGHLAQRAPRDELLREVLNTATGWPDVLRRLGYAEDSGSARTTIRRHAQRLGLDTRRLAEYPPAVPPLLAPATWAPDLQHLRAAGTSLVAAAFTLAGHRVCWPLEPAVYDLLVDTGDRLLRVQVKTTSRRTGDSWSCSITRSEYADVAGGKRRVAYSPAEIDVFAIVDGHGEIYLIPIDVVSGMTNLVLRRYTAYRIPTLRVESERAESG
jgi:hypothetical protein